MHFLFFISLLSYSFLPKQDESVNTEITSCADIPLPASGNRKRIAGYDLSFAAYLRGIHFKNNNTVLLYNGAPKSNQSAHYRVLDLGVGKRDLQQCADAVIRLRAEYLFKNQRYEEISFHFTSGHLCKWNDFADGLRPEVGENSVRFTRKAGKDHSWKNFNRYLDLVYSYCGTASLYKELKPKSIFKIEPGDVLIKTGDPYGHAVIVMDVAEKENGQRSFILAQSYMPAQEIHILKNPVSAVLSPWYEVNEGDIQTPEWVFNSGDLMSWK